MNKEKMTLKKFFARFYADKRTRKYALEILHDNEFIKNMGWRRVFHEGMGEGIAAPFEGVVAIYDDEDTSSNDRYHDYGLYKYDNNAWVDIELIGWDEIYAGHNGAKFEVTPL